MVFPFALVVCEVWRRTPGLDRAFPADRSGAFDRFALANGASPMLETARIGGDAGIHRSVAQLVEHRSPKPGVAGSSPATPANYRKSVIFRALAKPGRQGRTDG